MPRPAREVQRHNAENAERRRRLEALYHRKNFYIDQLNELRRTSGILQRERNRQIDAIRTTRNSPRRLEQIRAELHRTENRISENTREKNRVRENINEIECRIILLR